MFLLRLTGLFILMAACTTTQVDNHSSQDGAFVSVSYDRNLDEQDTTLRSMDETVADANLHNVIRRDFYLPPSELKSINKRAQQAREKLQTRAAKNPEALRVLAVEALVLGRPEQVQGFLFLSKNKKSRRNITPEDQLLLGLSSFMLGDVADARGRLTEAAASVSAGATARANLGLVAMKQGSFLEALDMFRQAESMEPKNVQFLHMVAEAAHAARKHTQSVESYRRILALEPDDFQARYNLGLVYHYGLRDYASARKEFLKVIDHPRVPRSMRALADGAFANLRQEEEGVHGLATTTGE